jgi:hypothetical protein
MKKTVNLADKQAALELLKQLYRDDEVKDAPEITDTERESGTKSISDLAKLPPNCS